MGHNFHGGRDVEIVLRGERIAARATLSSEPTEVASRYQDLLDEGHVDARHLGLKIHVDRKPTLEELAEMVRATGLSIVWLDLED
jgi:hypothetical protein